MSVFEFLYDGQLTIATHSAFHFPTDAAPVSLETKPLYELQAAEFFRLFCLRNVQSKKCISLQTGSSVENIARSKYRGLLISSKGKPAAIPEVHQFSPPLICQIIKAKLINQVQAGMTSRVTIHQNKAFRKCVCNGKLYYTEELDCTTNFFRKLGTYD